ncbi:hypothetical protein [Salirhabdus sp. Marseille-P4669]|uniref:hypothetical protein n=1 Tax=Salirhabdus sp. Marseille-P4669 TaxID=2042310 RepID=UPI000C7E4700|nr:hypothetical protein [Salirhabdus sp. Marseille-P4669]
MANGVGYSSCFDEKAREQFPSPNSCLPREVLEEVELKIAAANQFLLSLALDENQELHVFNGLRNAFNGLIGQRVDVTLNEEEEELGTETKGDTTAFIRDEESRTSVTGRVLLSGRNVVILQQGKKKLGIPFGRICEIRLSNRFAEPFEESSLSDLDDGLKRCLTYNFGATVSSSPHLIHIFYGLTLQIILLSLVNKKVKIILDDEVISGEIHCIDRDSLTILTEDKEKTFSTEDIWYVIFKDLDV